MSRILRSTDIKSALRSRQRGFLLNSWRFGGADNRPALTVATRANVVLQLRMNGTDGSTTFTDNSPTPKTFTANGNARIRTANSKFGGAAGYFDGVGDWIQTADNVAWDPGTGDYTWQMWVCPDDTTPVAVRRIFGQGNSGGGDLPICFQQNTNGLWSVSIYNGAAYQGIIGPTSQASLSGRWDHLLCSKVGTTMRFFVNGYINPTSGTITIGNAGQIFNDTNVLSFGRFGAYADQYYKGYVDDVQFVKGQALATAEFLPPTAELPII